jgi:hypothetical protein
MSAYRSLPEVARFQSWESFTPDDAATLIATKWSRARPIRGFSWRSSSRNRANWWGTAAFTSSVTGGRRWG